MESPKPPNDLARQPQSASLGRYRIEEELGRGAMGAVYKAFDPVIARTVALKTISIDDHAPDRTQMIERLKQEAKAAGGLDHPNIITIYDVGEENGAVYLSMQFVKGVTLAKVLADTGVPALPTVLAWADQILAAVGFAHARGVIHRDLKPANLMVTEQGAIKVLDFGIAKIENTSLTQTGLVIGTPAYMSPEQIAGKKVDHRADIFSLGAVFYELLTCEKAFAGDIATILYKIVNEDPVAPSLVNPAIPGGIDAVVRKALAKDPKDRFQTCEEMRHAFLEHFVRAPLTAAASTPAETVVVKRPSTPASPRRSPRHETKQIGPHLMLVSALVLLAATSWAFYVRSQTGAFPPLIAKLESKVEGLASAGKLSGGSTQVARQAGDEHTVAPVSPQNTAPATPTLATEAPAVEASPTPADTSPVTGPNLQPVAAQSSGDHPASESGPVSGPTLAPGTAEASQKPVVPTPSASQAATESGDNNQASARNATGHDSTNSPFAPRDDDTQTVPSARSKTPIRKRTPESAWTAWKVDGFTRQDVPDLLRQADSYAARGENRLARYEYGLVLKLDHNNMQAREGLRRLQAPWLSR